MAHETPGDPHGIRSLAQHWSNRSAQAHTAATTLRSAQKDITGGELRLRGDFAPKIQEVIGDLPSALDKLSRGYAGCSAALNQYADRLEQAQTTSRQARDGLEAAGREQRAAELRLDQQLPGWQTMIQRTGDRETLNPAAPSEQTAQAHATFQQRTQARDNAAVAGRLAGQAKALRDNAEQDCAGQIGRALDDSDLRDRSWCQKTGDFLKKAFTTWDGFVELCEQLTMVLGVLAPLLGPIGLAILAVLTVIVLASKIKDFADGKIGWKELAFEGGMVLLSRFGGKALGAGLKALRNTKAVKAFSDATHARAEALFKRYDVRENARNLAHRGICAVTGHPVDIATGKVFTDFTDLELPGPLPLRFERVWYSTSAYTGPLGHGWHHSYDAVLHVTADAVLYRTPDGRAVDLLPMDPGDEYYERAERLTVARDDAGYRLRDADGLTQRFTPMTGGDPTEPVTYVLTGVVNRAGHRITLSYDGGRLTEIVDSGGRSIRFDHDEQGRITTMTAPHPDLAGQRFPAARYDYDDAGNLTTMTDALGHVVHYAYDDHLLVRETDRTGLSFFFAYDGAGERARCVRTWGDTGIYDHHLRYEPGRTTVIDSLGHATHHEHDGGLVVRRVDALGGEWLTRYDYRQPVERTDPLGRVTIHEYDWRGNEIRTVTPDDATVEAVFDDRDVPLAATDPVGGRWTWEYDDAGLLTARRDPLGRTWTFRYTDGLLTALTDPAGAVTALRFDEQGSLARLTTPDGGATHWRRDALGRPTGVTDPLGNEQRRTFDLSSRATRVDEPDGNIRDLSYDGEGNLLRATDRLYDVTFTYQGMGRLATRTQAGTTVQFEYDTEEQLTGIVNEHGHVYRFDYGPTGEVSAERGFDGVLRRYERDVAGRVVTVRRASGLMSRYRYDGADRVIRVDHSDGTAERFAYRPDGALSHAGNGTGTVAFERDVLGRVTRERQGDHWVSSEYDVRGLRTRMRSSLGADQIIERDVMGDVTAVTAGEFTAGFTRDALGQELTRALPGGVHARWHRDRLGRPARQEVRGPAGTVRNRSYDWDVDDRLRGVADAFTGPIGYGHDALGQLASARYADGRVELRMPDAVGNLFRTADRSDRVYGPAGQLLESMDDTGRRVRYAYDAEGNLISKQASDGEAWTYRWNAAGHLAEVVRPDGSMVTFGYDPLGRRISKTLRGQTTHWVWDGNVPLHEWVEGALQPVAVRVGAPGEDGVAAQREALLSEFLLRGPPERGSAEEPITWLFEPETFAPMARLAGGRRESIVTDHLGTPVNLLDEAGALTWSAEIGIWGEASLTAGDAWRCPFRWPGQYEDPETGLYYNRFRYYDPESGQYTSQDPIRLLGSLTVHAYVPDSTSWFDPLGLRRLCEDDSHTRAEENTPNEVVYPPNNGALGDVQVTVLKPGEQIDRFGWDGGRFVSPNGTPYGARALPPGSRDKPYAVYEVTSRLVVQRARVAPWFGEPGLGIQYHLPASVKDLLGSGHLRRIGERE